MSFLVSDITATLPKMFSGRTLITADLQEDCRKAVLELTENYPFPGLQVTGPVQPVTVGLNVYSYVQWQQPADVGLEINNFDSFFVYYNGPPIAGAATNPGFPLRWKSIKDLEILTNIMGLPTNWTRHEGNIYIAMSPDQPYYSYLRYQKEHPFPNAGTGNAGNDPILLPNSWQDIVEYATALRTASNINLDERKNKFYQMLFGDPKFQASGGTEGAPGLIAMRTSQNNRDRTTTTSAMRLMVRPVMK